MELNDIELYMSIQLATALLAIFAGLIPHVGWAIRKLIPTFVALKATSDNTFLRTQAHGTCTCWMSAYLLAVEWAEHRPPKY